MSPPAIPPLASIEAVRPVFLIVMGVFLSIFAWRLAKAANGWTARTLVAGAMMLGFGYAVMLPLYDAGVIERFSTNNHYHGAAATAVAWHVVKMVVMNMGWLLFGTGIALHAGILSSPTRRPHAEVRKISPQRTISPHESIA